MPCRSLPRVAKPQPRHRLVLAEDMHGETPPPHQCLVGARAAVYAYQHHGRVEGDGGEGIGRHPRQSPLGIEYGHHCYAGHEPAERAPEVAVGAPLVAHSAAAPTRFRRPSRSRTRGSTSSVSRPMQRMVSLCAKAGPAALEHEVLDSGPLRQRNDLLGGLLGGAEEKRARRNEIVAQPLAQPRLRLRGQGLSGIEIDPWSAPVREVKRAHAGLLRRSASLRPRCRRRTCRGPRPSSRRAGYRC